MVPVVSAKVLLQLWQMYCRFVCEWTPMRSLAPQSDLGHTTNSGRIGGSVYLVIPPSKHRCARLCQIQLQPMLRRYLKTQVSSIYHKLGVHRRAEAIATASACTSSSR